MNAHARTALDLAAALSGKSRAAQTIHVCRKTFRGGSDPRIIVLVTPTGSVGEYYEIGPHALSALEAGMTPADLEMEPIDDPFEAEELEAENECEADAWARHCYSARTV